MNGFLLSVLIAVGAILFLELLSYLVYRRALMDTISEFVLRSLGKHISIKESTEEMAERLNMLREKGERRYSPPKSIRSFRGFSEYDYEGIQVFTLNKDSSSGRVVFYLPGGGFMKFVKPFHWMLLKGIARHTDAKVVLAQYPTLPFHNCRDVYPMVVDLYRKIVAENPGSRMVLAGDSSGGNIALRLAEYLAMDGDPQPDEIILMAPASGMYLDTDLEMLKRYERTCPFIGIEATIALGEYWLGGEDLEDPDVSPLFGVSDRLGPITLFAGTRDLLYPSSEQLDAELTRVGARHEFIVGRGLNHVYPLHLSMASYRARLRIYGIIRR